MSCTKLRPTEFLSEIMDDLGFPNKYTSKQLWDMGYIVDSLYNRCAFSVSDKSVAIDGYKPIYRYAVGTGRKYVKCSSNSPEDLADLLIDNLNLRYQNRKLNSILLLKIIYDHIAKYELFNRDIREIAMAMCNLYSKLVSKYDFI